MGREPENTEPKARVVRWKPIGVVAVIGVAVAGIGGYFLVRHENAQEASALHDDWGALQGCVLGDALGAGETARTRVRGIQLTVLGSPRDPRTKAGELGWPARCAEAASALADHAGAADTGGPELKRAAKALATIMRESTNATTDITKLVEEVWKDAAAASLTTAPSHAEGTPKAAVARLSREALTTPSGISGAFALANLHSEPAPTTNLRFLIDDSGLVGGPTLCTASGVPTTLACKAVGGDVAKHSPGLTLAGTTDADAQPWIFAGDRGQLGVFRPGGTAALTGDFVVGSTVAKDGSAWLLGHPANGAANELDLTHAALTGDVTRGRPILDGELETFADATLVWDWILELTGPSAHPASHLVGHRLSDQGDVGPLVDLGDAAALDRPDREDKQPRFASCRSGDDLAVRVHGAHADAVAFYAGTQWTAPIALTTRGGVLACHGKEVIVTQIARTSDPDGSHAILEEARCKPTGCTTTRVPLRELLAGTDTIPEESTSFTATEIDGKVLLVWSAGPLGGLRMRYAAPDRLKATPDDLIVDTQEENGQSTVTDLRLLPTPDGAILFVNTTTGARLFNVDTAGKLSPLRTRG